MWYLVLSIRNVVEWTCFFIYFTSLFFLLFRAARTAHGGSQAMGQIRAAACWPTAQPQPQPQQIWASSVTYTTAHGNARSLTHWERPGIEPATSWFLVGFVSIEPRRELRTCIFFKHRHTRVWTFRFAGFYSSANRQCEKWKAGGNNLGPEKIKIRMWE